MAKTNSAIDLSIVDVSCAKVDDDVGNKHDVNEYVDDEQRMQRVLRRVGWSRLGPVHQPVVDWQFTGDALAEQEGGSVRREDGRVDDKHQGNPVPDGLERRVVQDDEARNGRGRRTTEDRDSDRRLDVAASHCLLSIAAAFGMWLDFIRLSAHNSRIVSLPPPASTLLMLQEVTSSGLPARETVSVHIFQILLCKQLLLYHLFTCQMQKRQALWR